LTYDDLLSRFGGEVASSSGSVAAYEFGWGRAIGLAGEAAAFTIVFDFTGTGYQATGMTLYDHVQMYNWSGATSGTIVTGYSTNGTDYTTLLTVASPAQNGANFGTTNQSFSFAQPVSTVWYTVTAAGSNLYPDQNMWGRANGTGQTAFSAAFTLAPVPEPMTMSLLAMGGAMALRRRMA